LRYNCFKYGYKSDAEITKKTANMIIEKGNVDNHKVLRKRHG